MSKKFEKGDQKFLTKLHQPGDEQNNDVLMFAHRSCSDHAFETVEKILSCRSCMVKVGKVPKSEGQAAAGAAGAKPKSKPAQQLKCECFPKMPLWSVKDKYFKTYQTLLGNNLLVEGVAKEYIRKKVAKLGASCVDQRAGYMYIVAAKPKSDASEALKKYLPMTKIGFTGHGQPSREEKLLHEIANGKGKDDNGGRYESFFVYRVHSKNADLLEKSVHKALGQYDEQRWWMQYHNASLDGKHEFYRLGCDWALVAIYIVSQWVEDEIRKLYGEVHRGCKDAECGKRKK